MVVEAGVESCGAMSSVESFDAAVLEIFRAFGVEPPSADCDARGVWSTSQGQEVQVRICLQELLCQSELGAIQKQCRESARKQEQWQKMRQERQVWTSKLAELRKELAKERAEKKCAQKSLSECRSQMQELELRHRRELAEAQQAMQEREALQAAPQAEAEALWEAPLTSGEGRPVASSSSRSDAAAKDPSPRASAALGEAPVTSGEGGPVASSPSRGDAAAKEPSPRASAALGEATEEAPVAACAAAEKVEAPVESTTVEEPPSELQLLSAASLSMERRRPMGTFQRLLHKTLGAPLQKD